VKLSIDVVLFNRSLYTKLLYITKHSTKSKMASISLATATRPSTSFRITNARTFSITSTSSSSPPLYPPSLTLPLTAHAKKYTPDHEWIELSSDSKTGTIGISTYAANALGDVVFVELPTVSLEVSRNDTIGSVESVKSASDIMTPVSGIITEANAVLEEKPSTINKSPEGEGWIAKIEVKDVKEIEGLMDEVAYKKFTEESEE
jgi:glycine cleavage system H protein